MHGYSVSQLMHIVITCTRVATKALGQDQRLVQDHVKTCRKHNPLPASPEPFSSAFPLSSREFLTLTLKTNSNTFEWIPNGSPKREDIWVGRARVEE